MDKTTYIANPIYDVVFRYMMEDNKVAKLFLSALIGEPIEKLVFSPNSRTTKVGDGEVSITVIRMDFSAKIKQEDGTEKVIIIELQKAKFYHQTMRFRRYLGKQYQNPENVKERQEEDEKEEALPIYPIYILGQSFTEDRIPVIKVQREYIDLATSAPIEEKHPFIEALTHDAIVVQIPFLKGSRRNVLEKFLSIFDQSQRIDEKGHILELEKEDYPKKYHSVIRRLNQALQTPDIEEDMIVEDEVVEEFHRKDEMIAIARKKAREATQREEQAKQREEQAKQREIEQKQLAEKERASKNLLIRKLHEMGSSIEDIAQLTQMAEGEIRSILGQK
ncbi:MAG: hypothetical protein AAGG68_07030 [Bacteroidota bacterium]